MCLRFVGDRYRRAGVRLAANVDAALEGPAISEEEHEVVLHAEEPVAEKRVVPKERVRLGKDTVTEERTVEDDLRREKIDVDDDARKGA